MKTNERLITPPNTEKEEKQQKATEKILCEMVTLMPCSYLSAPRCAGLIEKMIEIEPKVHTNFSSLLSCNKN